MKGKRSQEKRKSFGRKDRRKEEEKIPPRPISKSNRI